MPSARPSPSHNESPGLLSRRGSAPPVRAPMGRESASRTRRRRGTAGTLDTLCFANCKQRARPQRGNHGRYDPLCDQSLPVFAAVGPDSPLRGRRLRLSITDIRTTVRPIRARTEAAGTRDEAMEAIRALIDRIVLTPEDGELRNDLQGEIAAILQLCSESKKPASVADAGLQQIKLVAGAGFEPATFRL